MTYESKLRDTVLTLDVQPMRELDRRWFGIASPMDDTLMLATMHKIRLHLSGIPEAERAVSRDWLAENRYMIDFGPDGVPKGTAGSHLVAGAHRTA